MKKNIFLFFPSMQVGGVQILFLRLAKQLAKYNNYCVKIIDYKNGYLALNYEKNNNIELVEYNENIKLEFSDLDYVVFQATKLCNIPKNLMFSKKTHIVYWNLHPFNLGNFNQAVNKYLKNAYLSKIVSHLLLATFYKNEKKQLDLFLTNKSICFMDGENVKKTEESFRFKIKDPIIVPVTIEGISPINFKDVNQNTIHAVWLGRICDFKVHVLIYTIKKLAEVRPGSSITVIGDGPELLFLKNSVSEFKDINVKYINYISPASLKNKLCEFNIGFAMGTSALDLAKLGLPVVLLGASYTEIKCGYCFNWLYKSSDYTLGEIITEEHYSANNQSLKTITDQVLTNFNHHSELSYAYVKNNYHADSTTNKFLSFIENAQLSYDKIPSIYFNKNAVQKVHRLIVKLKQVFS